MNKKEFLKSHTWVLMIWILVNLAIIGAVFPFDYSIKDYYGTYYTPATLALFILIPIDAAIAILFIQNLLQKKKEQNSS